MSSQDSETKSEEAWSKVVVHEPEDSTQKVVVTEKSTNDEDGNDSEAESLTETAIIHHSHNNTAIFDEYPNNPRSISPKKYGSSNAQTSTRSITADPTHRKQQSTMYNALDSLVAGGTLQESLRLELMKLFEEEFKSEFLAKNEMIATLENETRRWKSESESRNKRYNELETKYENLNSQSKKLQKRVDTLQSLANVSDKQDIMKAICIELGIEFENDETPEQLANRIEESLSPNNQKTQGNNNNNNNNKDTEINNNKARDSIDNSNNNSSFSTGAGFVVGVIFGVVIGYIAGNNDTLGNILDKLTTSANN